VRRLDDRDDVGETVGLVGESGSGKTTIASAVLGFVPAAAGSITFDGEDIVGASRDRRRLLSASLQVVFQNPYSSLNPARTIGKTLAETLRPHGSPPRAEVAEILLKLEPNYREVLVLRFHEELSLEEIAGVTKAPLSTVKSRLYRGLAALKPEIERLRNTRGDVFSSFEDPTALTHASHSITSGSPQYRLLAPTRFIRGQNNE